MTRSLLFVGLLGACGEPSSLLEGLALQHVQAVGTHNSYHIAPADPFDASWAYTHASLTEQLATQGVRQFELDVWWDAQTGDLDVHHVPVLDDGTTCAKLTDCVGEIERWSANNPEHHPLVVLVEIKHGTEQGGDALLLRLDEILTTTHGDRLIRPAEVQGGAASLREAVESDGWPDFATTRGRVLYTLLNDEDWRDDYTNKLTTPGEVLFVDGDGQDLDIAAIDLINDLAGESVRVQDLVARNHLVRGFGDAGISASDAENAAELALSLASGAQFLSTDMPGPSDDRGYSLVIPEGSPSRCNPLTAPSDCSSAAIESLPPP